MVETANKPEIPLRPDFRSDAEVKLMKTLNKPRKVTGVKAGKIPLVKSKDKKGTWPAGNPTAVKFQHENEQYEHAEDEPYYASKEVERLEDKIEAQHAPSDIIARITVTRKERHKKSIQDLHEELGHLNKSQDPEIGDTLELSKVHLDGILGEIQVLFAGIQQDRILYSYPLKKLEALWDDVVAMLQKRSQVIETLHTDLEKAEADRAKQIAEIFKHYNILFREIAYLSNDAIEVLMDNIMFSSNILLVSNYKNYTKIISQLKIENIVKLRELRGKWEERLATWRDLHITDMKDNFVKFMNTPGIAESPDISNLISLMKKEQGTLSDRRLNKLKSVLDIKPPTCTEAVVLKWYEEVCDISRLLENMHSTSLSHLESIRERIVRECEEVADKMLANLKSEGVCSVEEADELKVMELMPLVAKWRVTTEELATKMDSELNDVAAKFNADIHILYQFKSASSRVWTDHQESVRTKYTLLMEKMNVCRVKHDVINQNLETDLDLHMDRMRQDTNEGELLASLEKSLNALKEIAASYDNFQVDMTEVIECYPEMISCDVVTYQDVLCSLLRVKHLMKSDEEGEEAPQGTIIQANNEQYLVAKDEDSSTFLTETTVATDAMEFGCDVAVPQSQFASLKMSIIELYICHLENWKVEVMSEAEGVVDSKINELKSEVELRHHIHAPRPIRMELDIYNVRVNELKMHSERVKQHTAGVILEITTLRNNFKDLTVEQSGKGKEFKDLVEQCEQALATLDKTAHLTSLQTKVTAAYDEHMRNIRFELADFRKKMEEKLNDLRESNLQFGLAFKPFSDGGNFGPDEIEIYQKKLEKCSSKIDNCETFILTELDGMESKCLDTAVEVTTNFENKLKLHILDVAFLEKINSWISNCQVKIKTEVAASNMMSKKLKDEINVLHKLIDSCARPHPDKPIVRPEEVLAAIPSVYNLFQDRIAYLDCAKVIQQPLVKMSHSTSEVTPSESLDCQSAVNLTKNILKLARKKTEPEDSEVFDKKKVADVKHYDWFIPREEKEKVVTKRGKSRLDTAERTKRSGSASSRNSQMSLILTDATSFMPIIKKILQEAQEALYLSSEACYAQYQGPPLRDEIADSLELCMDNLNKRLNYYYVQAEEYYNKCIQELRGLLTDVLNLHMEVPKLLFSEILEEYITSVSQTTCEIKHNFDKNKVKIESRREMNKSMLKPILGHPNNEHDLNNLCRNEEDRMIESSDVLNEFVNEMKNVETEFVKRFIESMNDCTQRLFSLFDQLITTDDVILGQVQEKRLPASVLLKKEQKGLLAAGTESVCNLSKSGQQIKLLELSDITQRPSSHTSSRSNKQENIINTVKFTPIHQETLASKEEVYEEYKRHYVQTVSEIEEISVRWVGSEEKWKQQWDSSVTHVRNLYAPS